MKKIRLPHIDSTANTVVLANGEFPSYGIGASLLFNSQMVVCCDGAVDKLLLLGKEPSAIVGDGDSIDEATAAKYASLMVRIPEQESNDLCKALDYCLSQGMQDITILGASGMRDDHALANIGVLVRYFSKCEMELITDYGVFNVVRGEAIFESFAKQQVSLFALDSTTKIETEGLLYQPPQGHLSPLWGGLSNEAKGDEFKLKTDSELIVFRVFDPKD